MLIRMGSDMSTRAKVGRGQHPRGKRVQIAFFVKNSYGSTVEKGIDKNLKDMGTATGKATIAENCRVDAIL